MTELNEVFLDPIIPNNNTLEVVIAEISSKLDINNEIINEYNNALDFGRPIENNIDIYAEALEKSNTDSVAGENCSNSSIEMKSASTTNKKLKCNEIKFGKQIKLYKKKRGRRRKLINKGKLRGIADYGKKERCFKCNQMIDMNYLFVYSEDAKPKIENKPFICFWCSLTVSKSEMLRDWDINPTTPVHCYRCECFRSKERFLPFEKNHYCIYCVMKKKRAYMLKNYNCTCR